jgi:DNA-binding beta-propeller fold protein YncE
MSVILGSGDFKYEALDEWQKLPEGVRLQETPGVAVNSKDHVHAITRNPENPVMVFDTDGHYLHGFGKGAFSDRTHAVLIGPDDSVWCADDGNHTITKFTPEGELLMTIGTKDQSSVKWSGDPFNRPTMAAVSRTTGNIYISDGYGNFRVHKYSPEGDFIKSWGEPGIDPGQFLRPHNIAVDADDRVYVADREAHRIQIFDADGAVLDVWNNIHLPNGMTIGPDGNIYIGELPGMTAEDPTPPGMGHRISILSPQGKLLARFGDPEEGQVAGKFIAPHGMGVDSTGSIYVGEVSFTIRGRSMNPPTELRSLSKLRKIS